MWCYLMQVKSSLLLLIALALAGCHATIGDARLGKDAQSVSVPIYPGATGLDNGENNGVIGATFNSSDPVQKVREFYAKELGVTAAGSMKGMKNGHEVSIIIVPGSKATTSVSIIEKK